MDASGIVRGHFEASMAAQQAAADRLPAAVAAAAETVTQALLSGGKMLACGNGGSAGDAMHIASELVNRFELDRPALPALALTADTPTLTSIANDSAYEQVFARQVHALGAAGDVLLAISTSGNSPNVVAAVTAAHERGLRVIALGGHDGGHLGAALDAPDVEIRAPAESTARIQEMHLVVIHALCDLIDRQLFGGSVS